MWMIKIAAEDNGAHRNQTAVSVIPEGWAVLPKDRREYENFPYGEPVVEELDGVLTVTDWTPGPRPERPVEPEPTVPVTPSLSARVAALEEEAEQAKIDRAALLYLMTGEEVAE